MLGNKFSQLSTRRPQSDKTRTPHTRHTLFLTNGNRLLSPGVWVVLDEKCPSAVDAHGELRLTSKISNGKEKKESWVHTL